MCHWAVELFQAWTGPKLRAPHKLHGWHCFIACAWATGEGKERQRHAFACLSCAKSSAESSAVAVQRTLAEGQGGMQVRCRGMSEPA